MNFKQGSLALTAAVALFVNQSARADQISRTLAEPEQSMTEYAAPEGLVAHCDSAAGDSRYVLDVILKGQGYHLNIDHIENQNTTRIQKNGRATRSAEDTVVSIQFQKEGTAEEKGSLVMKRNGKWTAEGSLTFTGAASIPVSCKFFDSRVFPHQFDGFYLKNCSHRAAHVTKIQVKYNQTRGADVVFEKGVDIQAGQELKVPSVYTSILSMAVWSDHNSRGCFRYRGYDNK